MRSRRLSRRRCECGCRHSFWRVHRLSAEMAAVTPCLSLRPVMTLVHAMRTALPACGKPQLLVSPKAAAAATASREGAKEKDGEVAADEASEAAPAEGEDVCYKTRIVGGMVIKEVFKGS